MAGTTESCAGNHQNPLFHRLLDELDIIRLWRPGEEEESALRMDELESQLSQMLGECLSIELVLGEINRGFLTIGHR